MLQLSVTTTTFGVSSMKQSSPNKKTFLIPNSPINFVTPDDTNFTFRSRILDRSSHSKAAPLLSKAEKILQLKKKHAKHLLSESPLDKIRNYKLLRQKAKIEMGYCSDTDNIDDLICAALTKLANSNKRKNIFSAKRKLNFDDE
mmetsp:Transcript_11261/g.15511  ORF Transcript_11261/g.15511 Transcript_11261/m.15511 type:complete len:144 (-) Transcript_11261:207-638(-)